MHTQAIRVLVTALLLVYVLPARAQLPAPMEFSNAGYAHCGNHTCLWLPFSAHRTFARRMYRYTVDVTGSLSADAEFVLHRGEKELLRTPLKDLSGSTSVVWADDDRSFAVTWSDGGSVGVFHVRAFHIEGDSVTELPAVSKSFEAFKARHWCKSRGDDVQAYQWLPDSRQLILILTVYPTSDCGEDLGHMEAYVVDASTGDIRQHWNLKELNQYIRTHPE
jgi:hypothetical protein